MYKYLTIITIVLFISCKKETKKTAGKTATEKSKEKLTKQTNTITNHNKILFETYSCRPR